MPNQNPFKDNSAFKPIAIVILIIVVLAGVYSVVFKKDASKDETSETAQSENKLEVNPSGLNVNDKVATVGDVEKVMSKWIEANPEAIIHSVMSMQQKAAEKQAEEAQKNISAKKADIFEHKATPNVTPKRYNVSVVEFFDYNCGYCKRAQNTIEKLLKEDKKVRVIFKEYPILGPSSEALSRVALAVNMLDSSKYLAFHDALMKSSVRTEEEAINLAGNVGIDSAKLKETLEKKKSEIEEQIKFNRELGASIGVNGTPAFIIGEEFVSGAVEYNSLKEKIAAQRKK